MKQCFLFLGGVLMSMLVSAQSITVDLHHITSNDKQVGIGRVTFEDGDYGLLIKPNLHGLPPGLHGFHIHINPDCGNQGLNAGGHLDPAKTGKHLGPYDKAGHLGDLPALFVNKKGQAILPMLAPRLHVRDILNHSVMIHAGADNYADTPEKLGGGGKRIACGVIQRPASYEEPASS